MQTSSIALILPLADANRSRRTGAKATNLSRIVAARFAVPRGFVISADAYRSHLWAGGTRRMASAQPEAEEREAIRAAILGQPIPDDVWQSIVDAYERLSWQMGMPEPKVAVRSSAIEDGPGYAGAYESYINVSGLDAVGEAIRRVWASLWSGKAAAYRTRFGATAEPAMAVIVQQMVESNLAGTAFTANPVTGDPHIVMVAARSGETAAHYSVDLRDLSVSRSAESGQLDVDEALVRLIAERSILIEDAVGGRVQIEWAVDRDDIWILQADPIEEESGHFPVPWQDESDGRAVWVRQGSRPISQFAQSLVESYPAKVGASQRVVNGYLYVRDGDEDPLAVGEVGKCTALLNRYDRQIGPAIRERIAGLLKTDWKSAEWPSCARSLRPAASAQRESYAWMRLAESMSARSRDLLREVVHDEAVAQRLLGGVDTASFQRSALLEDMAQRFAVAERSGKLEKPDWWKAYRREVELFARDYGCAFSDPIQAVDPAGWRSWIEDIEGVFAAIADRAESVSESTLVTLHCAAQQDAAAAESRLLDGARGKSRSQTQLVLGLARGWIGAAAEAEKDCARASAALRLVLIELARRLEGAGAISSVDDVFSLRLEELVQLQAKPDAGGRSELAAKIAQRKHQAWLEGRFVAPDRLP